MILIVKVSALLLPLHFNFILRWRIIKNYTKKSSHFHGQFHDLTLLCLLNRIGQFCVVLLLNLGICKWLKIKVYLYLYVVFFCVVILKFVYQPHYFEVFRCDWYSNLTYVTYFLLLHKLLANRSLNPIVCLRTIRLLRGIVFTVLK